MELLSPAGNFNAAIAALKGGSDALYLGGKYFSARMNAENFSDEEMKKIVEYAHLLRRKVFVTMNTLIYQDEFDKAYRYAYFLHSIGVDALIIQDLGFAHYLHQRLPNLCLHASTQLNCHNVEQAKALKEVGFTRIVLARESDIELAKKIKAIGLEVEIFIHGALCVSYSGNCLMSSFIGNRSGNRGRCAQPCRLPYRLVLNNNEITSNNYMLSTKDLMTLDYINKLVDCNVDSLKIEGRLKQNEYVYLVTKAYRNAIDSCIQHQNNTHLKEDKDNLIKIFSRKFTKGFLFNESPFELLNQNSSSHQGEVIGKVINVSRGNVYIKLNKKVTRLDGIRFNNKTQFGLQIQKMYVNNASCEQAFPGQIIELRNINIDGLNYAEVIRTSSIELLNKVNNELKKDLKIYYEASVYVYVNKPITISLKILDKNYTFKGNIIQEAINNGTSYEKITNQLSKSGDYPYCLKIAQVKGSDNVFIPMQDLNSIRNEILSKIKEVVLAQSTIIELPYINEKIDDKFNFEINAILKSDINLKNCIDNNIKFYSKNTESKYHSRIEKNITLNKGDIVHSLYIGENLIASPYCNITNSYALDLFYKFNYSDCILSLELDISSIKNIISDYYNRHQSYPKVSLIGYGKIDLMILKSCPIGTVYNAKHIHCNKCHEQNYFIRDRLNVDFPISGDEFCTTSILSNAPIYILDKTSELIKLKIKSLYLILDDVDEKNIIENAIENIDHIKPMGNIKIYRGHFLERAL